MVENNTAEERLGAESAYPLPDGTTQVRRWQAGYGEYRVTEAVSTGGLTKRELFAAMAMQGLCANSIHGSHHSFENTAREAVQYADALLKELGK